VSVVSDHTLVVCIADGWDGAARDLTVIVSEPFRTTRPFQEGSAEHGTKNVAQTKARVTATREGGKLRSLTLEIPELEMQVHGFGSAIEATGASIRTLRVEGTATLVGT
jgi:hypothetical protein